MAKPTPRVCGAQKQNGKVCMRQPGWGTNHLGRGRCKLHGGATPNGVAGAARVDLSLATPAKGVSPGTAMLTVMELCAGQLAYATLKVGELSDDELFIPRDKDEDTGTVMMIPHYWVTFQRKCMRDLSYYAKVCADAGIAERAQQLAEGQAEQMAKFLEAVLDDIKLTSAQRKQVGPAMRRRLELVQSEAVAA